MSFYWQVGNKRKKLEEKQKQKNLELFNNCNNLSYILFKLNRSDNNIKLPKNVFKKMYGEFQDLH